MRFKRNAIFYRFNTRSYFEAMFNVVIMTPVVDFGLFFSEMFLTSGGDIGGEEVFLEILELRFFNYNEENFALTPTSPHPSKILITMINYLESNPINHKIQTKI